MLNYLFAKKENLSFFLRIDDTDTERSKYEYIKLIIEDLKGWELNILKFLNSLRKKKYEEIFLFFKNKEFIYPCFESLKLY